MVDNTNPWADTANQAVGALYKHYLSQPSQADIQQNQLKTQLMRSQLESARSGMETDALQRQNIQSQIGARNFDVNQLRQQQESRGKFADAFSQVQPVMEPDVLPMGAQGPTRPGFSQGERNQEMATLFEQFAPQLDEDVVSAARDALGTANALRFDDPIQRQLAIDERATTAGAFDDGYTLSPGARRFDGNNEQVAYSPPKQGGGSSITMADGTIIDLDGGSGGRTEATRATQNKLQPAQIDLQMLSDTINTARGFSQDASNFGLPGRAKGVIQDTTIAIKGLQNIANNFGYEEPVQYFDSILKKQQSVKLPEGETQDYLNQLYDPNIDALKKTQIIMAYQAAAALGGQSGRAVSDRDIKHWSEVVGNPFALDMHQTKYNKGLDYLETLVGARTRVFDEAAGGNIIGSDFEGVQPPDLSGIASDQAPPAPTPGVVQINDDSEYEQLAPGTQFIAPDGTTRIKQ